MIFKNIFKPKWQHKDPVVRAQALQQLDDQSILNEIANRDVEAHVRRKALEKMASFAAWVNAMEKDSDQHLQKIAAEKVKLAVLGADSNKLTCSQEEVKNFLLNTHNNQLLEEVVRRSSDQSLRLTLLKKLNKEALLIDLVYREAQAEIAHYCYAQVIETLKSNPKQLEKIANKAASIEVRQLALAELEQVKLAKEKPVELKKELTLILSQLLALKDKTDYLQVQQDGELLVSKWQCKQAELSYLTDEEQAEFKQKYQTICDKLESSTDKLKQAYLTEKAKQDAIEQRKTLVENTEQQITIIDQKIAEAISHSGDAEQKQLLDLIESCKLTLEQSHETGRDIEHLFNQLNEYQVNVQHLDQFTEQVAQATRSLTQLSQKEIPSSLAEYDATQAYFREWLAQWRKNQKALLFPLPDSLAQSSKALIKAWQEAVNEIEAEQNKKTKRLFAKIRELKSLIRAGKYNAAFGLYRKMSQWHDELSELNKTKVEHELAQVNEQISDLEDWKAYIGLPRKQELLQEVKALVDSPMDDLQAQAEKIKFARQTWLVLGNVDSAENTQLNQEFDQLTEQAFAPCRAFYAELEQQRQENLKLKEAIIEQLTELQANFETNSSLNELGKQLFQIQSQWNKIGPIDKSIYKSINQKFYTLIDPLKTKVADYQKNNALLKTQLIEKAEAKVKTSEDINELTNELKLLQNQWKEIGFAGKHKENKLWSKFRAINDAVFNQKQAEYQAQKQKQGEAYDKLSASLSILEQQITENLSTPDELKANLNELDFSSVNKVQFERLIKWQKSLLAKIDAVQEKAIAQQHTAEMATLFSYLENLGVGKADSEQTSNPIDLSQLNLTWQNLIKANQKLSADTDSQKEITIKIEIIKNQPIPTEDTELRMQLQVQMLSDKMNSGDTYNAEQLLINWIECGLDGLSPLLIERVKNCFL
ncbi:DUF349 domain-containing protein [Catenovulum sp. 2E275]|uniref:DUF349 domain-containing protein n=1 Tax=Catenovulum sp. 2E275 TaxID=2980497 RepID=UPI0021D2E651|nr:DUF349 domain-containing protein [Catenovulum sp. 2E275]MCU4677166.1 DUF349 domain-containing protein [Catenovulum sp. 2E275]